MYSTLPSPYTTTRPTCTHLTGTTKEEGKGVEEQEDEGVEAWGPMADARWPALVAALRKVVHTVWSPYKCICTMYHTHVYLPSQIHNTAHTGTTTATATPTPPPPLLPVAQPTPAPRRPPCPLPGGALGGGGWAGWGGRGCETVGGGKGPLALGGGGGRAVRGWVGCNVYIYV